MVNVFDLAKVTKILDLASYTYTNYSKTSFYAIIVSYKNIA